MPVSYELLRIWYNTKMTLVITKNVFKGFLNLTNLRLDILYAGFSPF